MIIDLTLDCCGFFKAFFNDLAENDLIEIQMSKGDNRIWNVISFDFYLHFFSIYMKNIVFYVYFVDFYREKP